MLRGCPCAFVVASGGGLSWGIWAWQAWRLSGCWLDGWLGQQYSASSKSRNWWIIGSYNKDSTFYHYIVPYSIIACEQFCWNEWVWNLFNLLVPHDRMCQSIQDEEDASRWHRIVARRVLLIHQRRRDIRDRRSQTEVRLWTRTSVQIFGFVFITSSNKTSICYHKTVFFFSNFCEV